MDDLPPLRPREREVLALMAEGCSNAEVAARLHLSAAAVEKHVSSVFTKLGLSPTGAGNRRVLAVLRYLGHRTAFPSSQHSPGRLEPPPV